MRHDRLLTRCAQALLATLLPAMAALAGPDAPFATTDQNPLLQTRGLPSPAESALPAPGDWNWRAALDVASHSVEDEAANGERIVLDGESWRLNLGLSRGVGERVALTVDLPLIAHSGGTLDALIEGWHDAFGLSNDRRSVFARNRLVFRHVAPDGERLTLTDSGQGVGDLRLGVEWRVRAGGPAARSLSVRASAELPTGSESALRGSGATDVALQLMSTDRATLARWNTTLSWMLGGIRSGAGNVLPAQRREFVAIASAGVAHPLTRRLSARLQLDAHGPFYDSPLWPLGSSGVQLALGVGIDAGSAGVFDIAVTENLRSDTTPDFGLHLGWRGML